ncbi:MAG: efflux RND transporter permease subunit, partial [Deltaproteobacteria bacterium]|nr:efflux RND transporter permease subunit [Deltaproteobacteria bacterium]
SAPTFYYNVVPRRRGTPFYAQAFVDVADGQWPQQVVRDLQTAIDQKVFDSRVIVRQLEQGPPFDAPIEIRVFGSDLATLQPLGSQLRVLLSETPNVIHTRSDLQDSIPKLVVDLDSNVVQRAGLNATSVAQFLYTTVQGAAAGSIFDGVEELPVRVNVNLKDAAQADQLASLVIPTQGQPKR